MNMSCSFLFFFFFYLFSSILCYFRHLGLDLFHFLIDLPRYIKDELSTECVFQIPTQKHEE